MPIENCHSGCTKATYTVLEILAYLYEKEIFCVADVLEEFELDKQAFMRHLKTIRVFFKNKYGKDIAENTSKGCFRVINRHVLKQALNFGDNKEQLGYIQILQDVLPNYYNKLDKRIQKRVSSEEEKAKSVYYFHQAAKELSADQEILSRAESSIKKRRKADLVYDTKKGFRSYNNIRPLRIIFMEGNLYLACLIEDKTDYLYTTFRIYKIKEYTLKSETFNDTDIVTKARDFSRNFQTSFSNFEAKTKEVVLLVSKDYAAHFLQKKYLCSQEEKLKSDGNLLVTYQVDSYKEIRQLVKKWIPNIWIVKPEEWKEELRKELTDYLKTF